jgi:hypothetical protein
MVDHQGETESAESQKWITGRRAEKQIGLQYSEELAHLITPKRIVNQENEALSSSSLMQGGDKEIWGEAHF